MLQLKAVGKKAGEAEDTKKKQRHPYSFPDGIHS